MSNPHGLMWQLVCPTVGHLTSPREVVVQYIGNTKQDIKCILTVMIICRDQSPLSFVERVRFYWWIKI